MKKLLNIIITIIIRYQSYYFKPEDKFSEILEIEKLFMKTAIKLMRKDAFRLFDITIILENKKNIDLLYRLKQEYHLYKNGNIIYTPENSIQEKLLDLLVTPMSEETFKVNFLNIMSKSLKKLIIQKHKSNFQLYLSEELNYLLLNTLPLKDILNYLGVPALPNESDSLQQNHQIQMQTIPTMPTMPPPLQMSDLNNKVENIPPLIMVQSQNIKI